MTANAFASLGPATFNRLVAARRAVVTAGDAYDAADRACVSWALQKVYLCRGADL